MNSLFKPNPISTTNTNANTVTSLFSTPNPNPSLQGVFMNNNSNTNNHFPGVFQCFPPPDSINQTKLSNASMPINNIPVLLTNSIQLNTNSSTFPNTMTADVNKDINNNNNLSTIEINKQPEASAPIIIHEATSKVIEITQPIQKALSPKEIFENEINEEYGLVSLI